MLNLYYFRRGPLTSRPSFMLKYHKSQSALHIRYQYVHVQLHSVMYIHEAHWATALGHSYNFCAQSENVSFKDLQNQRVMLPILEYHNRNWTWTDMLMEVKKDYKNAIISQVGTTTQMPAMRRGDKDKHSHNCFSCYKEIISTTILFATTIQIHL